MNADCGTTGPATPGLTVPLTAPLLAVSKNWSGAAALVGYMFSDQTLKLAVSNNHLVITWRQSPWIHRHIIAISFSRSNTVILKFISDLPQVAENSSAASATPALPTIDSSIGIPAAESTSLGHANGKFRIIKKGKTGLRRLFEIVLSFPIIAEAPIPLPETLGEPSLEEPSIRETEPAAHEVTYEIVEAGSRQQHRKLIDSRGYSYNVKRRTKTAVIWQCTVRKGHYCKATVKEVDGAFHETQVHDHQPAVGAATAAKVVSAVKRKALEDIFKPASAIVQEVYMTSKKGIYN